MREDGSRTFFGLIVRDAHFWIPVIVLAGGLLVLASLR
jgi:hypothetical protein